MKADVESAVLDLYTEDVYGNADEGSLFNVCRTDTWYCGLFGGWL